MPHSSRRRTMTAATAALAAQFLPVSMSAARAQGSAQSGAAKPLSVQGWPLTAPATTGIHDVAPAPDGGVWFSAQRSGHLGYFDPRKGKTELIALGAGSSPHGVIAGPDGAAWLTDGGQNAIARVAWPSREVRLFRLPESATEHISVIRTA